MKSLRKLLAVSVLTLVLTCSALAGEMDTGIVQQPPQPSATTAGEMDTGLRATNETATGDVSASVNPAGEVALNLLRSVLLLF
jgi:hypothetical protein